MYCSKCGNQIADGSRFCSFCGTPVPEVQVVSQERPEPAPEPQPPAEPEPEPARRHFIEDINWNVNEYPNPETIEKTDDIDFDWGADPAEIRERLTREYPEAMKTEIREKADALSVDDIIPSKPETPVYQPETPSEAEPVSAADKIDKFYTFSRKNEEFQQLLNREYDKIKGGNPIEKEKELAEQAAAERFEVKEKDSSMEAFLDREGVNKPYEPKAFESDVLQRIEAHERALEAARAEEEARRKMIEEERAKAAEQMRAAEEARIRAAEEERERIAREARALAEEEVRKAEEAARLAAEEAARAEEEASRLEAEAAAKLAAEEELRRQEEARLAREAVEEARLRNEERERAEAEAILRAQEEARARAEEEARLAAEEEARRKAAEEKARLEAEEALRIQQQAEKIRAQQEARQAATEKEKRIAEIERRRQEEEELKNSLEKKQADLRLQAESAAAAEEARKVLASTKQMREEEAAKIRAAIAGLKGEPVKEEPAPPAPAAPAAPARPERPVEQTIQITPEMMKAAAQEAIATPVKEPTIIVQPEPPKPVEREVTREEAARIDAHRATQADLSKMAEARAKFLSEFGIDPISGKPSEPKPEPAEPVPATVEELLGEKPVTTRDTMISQINENAQTKTVSKDDVLRGIEDTRRISKEELRAAPVIPAEELETETQAGLQTIHHTKTVEQMLEELSTPAEATELGAVLMHENEATPEAAQDVYEPVMSPGDVSAGEAVETEPAEPVVPAIEIPETELPEAVVPTLETLEPAQPETIAEGFAAKEEPMVTPDTVAMEGLKPGLNDTMVMTGVGTDEAGAEDSFAQYGEQEAEQLRIQQEAEAAAAAAAPVAEPAAPVAETVAPVAETVAPAEPAKAAPAKKPKKAKGGAGRTVLKVLLIILIIVFVIELAGIAIKWLAPDSGAAEFIDNQLNKIIHLITGSEPDYQIPGIDYEV